MPETQASIFCINAKASQADKFDIEGLAKKHLKNVPYHFIKSTSVEEQSQALDKLLETEKIENPVIIACGGDGTVLGVIQYILKRPDLNLKLGILPVGTGNLLAKSLEITEDPHQYLERLNHETVEKSIALGSINSHIFSLAASCGIDVKIMEKTPAENKKTLGIYAYLVEGLSTLFESDTFDYTITIDGKTFKTRAKSIMVIHHQQFLKGLFPFLNFTTDTKQAVKKNCLDLIILNPSNAMDYLSLFYSILTSEFLNTTQHEQAIQHFQGKVIEIKTETSLPIQVDGDVIEKTPAKLAFKDTPLTVVIPKQAHFNIKNILPLEEMLKSTEDFKKATQNFFNVF